MDDISADDIRELELYAENTSELHPQFQSIIRTLTRRIAKGTYDPKRAPKAWRNWYDKAAHKRIAGEYFPAAVRQACAEAKAIEEYENIKAGEYA